MQGQWYYEKDERTFGPVPWEHLAALATAGQIEGDDSVWEVGSGEAPRRVADLLPLGRETKTNGEKPSSSTESTWSKRRQWAQAQCQSLAAKTGAAAKLTVRQTERLRLANMTLPSAYLALGREIRSEDRFRDDLADLHDQLDAISQRMSTLRQTPNDDGEFSSLLEGAKKVVRRVAVTPQIEALALKARGLLQDLGRDGFAKHGASSGSQELVSRVDKAEKRLTALKAEIDTLQKSKPGELVTPARIAIGGLAAIGVAALVAAPKVFAVARRVV